MTLMVKTITNHKLHHTDTEIPSSSSAVDDESTDLFQLRESNVSLYDVSHFDAALLEVITHLDRLWKLPDLRPRRKQTCLHIL